jgi:hypothetical protein
MANGLDSFILNFTRPNVPVPIYVDPVMLPVAFDVHAEMHSDTPEIMHPQPLLHLVLDLPNQALNSNVKDIMDVQNDNGDDYAVMLLVIEHKQSSVDA